MQSALLVLIACAAGQSELDTFCTHFRMEGGRRECYTGYCNAEGDTVKLGWYRAWTAIGRLREEGWYYHGEKDSVWRVLVSGPTYTTPGTIYLIVSRLERCAKTRARP